MLITAKHLLVLLLLMALAFASGIGTAWLVDPSGGIAAAVAGAIVAIILPLLVAWPMFRAFSLRPLILPICPHCSQRHLNYHIPRNAWPSAVVICGHCGKPLRLKFGASRRSPEFTDMPTVAPQWPRFLGVWRVVAGKASQTASE